MSNSTLSPSISLECPKCGKHTIVEQPTGTYRCIACDFKRDFGYEEYQSSKKDRGRNSNRDDDRDRRSQDSDEEEVNPFPLLLIGGILIVLLV